jgi:hypothetical protein
VSQTDAFGRIRHVCTRVNRFSHATLRRDAHPKESGGILVYEAGRVRRDSITDDISGARDDCSPEN